MGVGDVVVVVARLLLHLLGLRCGGCVDRIGSGWLHGFFRQARGGLGQIARFSLDRFSHFLLARA